MEFEWDEAKDRANRLNTVLISLLPAASLTDRVRRFVDPRPWGEQRLVATGQVEGRFITVVYTRRGDRYRVISARPARSNERF